MRKYFRQAGYFAAILILLPYVVTILLNGRSSLAQDNGTSPYVTVKSDEKNRKISLDEYGIGILAKEIEGDAEEEALKAQAVLIRTSIYKSIQDEGTSTVLTKEYWTRQQMESNWGADHYGEYYEKMKAAWDETRGQVLMYDGRLILTPVSPVKQRKNKVWKRSVWFGRVSVSSEQGMSRRCGGKRGDDSVHDSGKRHGSDRNRQCRVCDRGPLWQ